MVAAAATQEPLTRSVEDYLKAIYHLSLKGAPAGTSDIAHQLDLSPPSVSGMIKRLAEQGLLEHEPYKGVELTGAGRRLALRMVRRHRLLETYLVEFLGYDWDTVHEEAERLEHAVSDTLIERMAAALGNPRVDPHGDPIPGPDGTVVELVFTPLPEVEIGATVVIRRVDATQADRLRYLATLGLKPGTELTVLDRQPFHGPITISSGNQDHIVGHELAMALLCAPTQSGGE
jgi:DtxR family transcriptional regulator, Mn-dependent transcriptional regulator